MARYNHLPIYKESYQLLVRIMILTKNYPREYKYSLGEKLQNHVLELLVDIYQANSNNDKTKHINSILEHIQYIGLFIRVSMDIQIINEIVYTELLEKTQSISKQATAWLNFIPEEVKNNG